MRPLVCWIATSMEGVHRRPAGEIDWLFADLDYGSARLFADVDAVVMDQKTYDLCRTFGEYHYPDMPNSVWSRSLRGSLPDATGVPEHMAGLLGDLRQRESKTIRLVGGSALAGKTLPHDLLDEPIVSVHPIILGDGVPLFPRGIPRRTFRLDASEPAGSGLAQPTWPRAR